MFARDLGNQLHEKNLKAQTAVLDILLVEDNELDAYAIERTLGANFPCPTPITRAGNLADAEQILQSSNTIKLILLDLGLPDSTGPQEVLSRLDRYAKDIPIIVLTSIEDHNLAMSILGGGIQDYVYKASVTRDPEALCRTIQFAVKRHYSNLMSRRQMVSELEEKKDLLNLVTGSYSVMG